MKEIEIKVKVESFEPIIGELEKLDCTISEPIAQNDIIFDVQEIEGKKRNILRIRRSGDSHLLTLKQDVTDELDCIEKEVKISDPEIMREIIELLGYSEVIRVNKKRRRCVCNDYEICLDDVEGLGLFVEVEKFSDKDATSIRKDSMEFLGSLGIDVSNRVEQGYDTMLEQKRK